MKQYLAARCETWGDYAMLGGGIALIVVLLVTVH